MNEFSNKGYLYKIFFHHGFFPVSVYLIEGNMERSLYHRDDCGLDIHLYSNIFSLLEEDENLLLCYRYQKFYQRYRAYLEYHQYIEGKIKKQELCSCARDTLNEALINLNEEVVSLKLGKG